jgi:ABC-type thiamin/hydroxymethylpyrimidine transport system permease subunit
MTTEQKARRSIFDRLTTRDIVVIVIVGAVLGAIGVYNMPLNYLLSAIFGVFGWKILSGIFHTPGVMAANMTRKRWVAFITQNLFAVTQLLLGASLGLSLFWLTVFEGVGQELVFFIFRYKKWRWWTICLAGMASSLFASVPSYFLFGLGDMPWYLWIPAEVGVGMLSAAFANLVISWGIPAVLSRIGVFKLPAEG